MKKYKDTPRWPFELQTRNRNKRNKGQTTITSDRKPWSVPIYVLSPFTFGYIDKAWVLDDFELIK